MKQSIIGEIYHSFTIPELKELDQYIDTSQWQYRETIVRCHKCIQEFVIHNKLDKLDKRTIYRAIYEEEIYNDGKLRFVFNRLLEAIKEYRLLAQNKIDNVFTQKVWMDFLIEKKLRKNIQYNIEKKEVVSTSEYRFLLSYFKSQEENIHTFATNKDTSAQFSSITNIMKKAELFSDLVFIKYYCSLITFTNVYQSLPFDLPIDKLTEIKNKHWERIYPEFLVFTSLIDLLIDRDSIEKYYIYKKNLFTHFDFWNDEEKNNFLVYLLNFNTNQLNKGNQAFIEEQFDLYNLFEEKDIFQLKNIINPGRINNVIVILLRKKEFKKAEDFIAKYIQLLDTDSQASCMHFNMARISFEKSNYKLSLRELLQVDFSQDPGYSLNSKLLLLKNYFELKESDAFDSLCSSFKEFIRKNKVISNNHKTYYLNFIKLISKIYGAPPTKLKRLHTQIKENQQIAEKNWLLEKCSK